MAEESAAPKEAAAEKKDGKPPILLYLMAVVNMLTVAGVGAMVYLGKQKEAKEPGIKDVIKGEHEAQEEEKSKEKGGEKAEAKGEKAGEKGGEKAGEKGEGEGGEKGGEKGEDDLIGKTVPLEQFLVNLAGNRGRGLLKLNLELEVDGQKVMEEIEKRKPQVRDIIIILLSSKTYAQISTAEGKDVLRDEIRDTVNSFLTRGKIKKVLFTEFIFD